MPGGAPITLNQSGAIILYCAEKSGRLIPSDSARRALAMQWFTQAASDISGASMTVFRLENSAPERSDANVEYFKKRLRDAFGDCDRALQNQPYLAGELSIADLMLYPTYAMRRALLEEHGGFDYLHSWGKTMAARPAIQRAMRYAS